MAYPALDLILDSTLIPSLNRPQSQVQRHQLLSSTPAPPRIYNPIPSHQTHATQCAPRSIQHKTAGRSMGQHAARGRKHERSESDELSGAMMPGDICSHRSNGGNDMRQQDGHGMNRDRGREKHRGHARSRSASMESAIALRERANLFPPEGKAHRDRFAGKMVCQQSSGEIIGSSLPLPRNKGRPVHPSSVSKASQNARIVHPNASHCTTASTQTSRSRDSQDHITPPVRGPLSSKLAPVDAREPLYLSSSNSPSPPRRLRGSGHAGSTTCDPSYAAGLDNSPFSETDFDDMSSTESTSSAETSGTARPTAPAPVPIRPMIRDIDIVPLPDLHSDFSKTLASLIPLSRRPQGTVPRGHFHAPSVLLALGYVLELVVHERTLLKASQSRDPAAISASKRTKLTIPPAPVEDTSLICPRTGSLLWPGLTQHLSTMTGLLLPYLASINSQPYSRPIEKAAEGARTYILKIRKIVQETAALYADQYGFMQGWWDQTHFKGAAREIGLWCEELGV